MPENFLNISKKKPASTKEQLGAVTSLLGRKPTVLELEILSLLLINKEKDVYTSEKVFKTNHLTNELNYVLKTELIEYQQLILKFQDQRNNQVLY